MPREDPLRTYREKRDFARTPEPKGRRRRAGRKPVFVVQKHGATRLHYDLRLEAGGVLRSWAVAKGPSTNPRDKRLALSTEDHPLEYAEFEGVIPEGEYGAGPMIVWDRGPYRNLTERDGEAVPIDQALDEGHVVVGLEGKKLTGAYLLRRMGRDRRKWLLIKKRDEGADARRNLLQSRPESILSGKSLEEIAADADGGGRRRKRVQPGWTAPMLATGSVSQPVLRVGRHRVEVSNPDKVLYPDDDITKADLIDYYRSVAKHMLPFLKGRPIAMERYPDGLEGERIFQKHVPRHFPPWVTRVRVRKERGTLRQVVVDKAATLVYLANQACLTIHTFLSRADRLRFPDQLIFDLDPPGREFGLARRAALALRELLEEELELPAFARTSGGDGLHVLVPLDRSEDFDKVRAFATDVAGLLVRRDPEHVTVEQRKPKRGRRLFVDVMRNSYAQTAVAPYAVRARKRAPVATPLEWDEVRDARLRPDRFTLRTIPRRLAREPSAWKNLTRRARSLSRARERLEDLLAEA